jgi:plasmid maintenance system killer protein
VTKHIVTTLFNLLDDFRVFVANRGIEKDRSRQLEFIQKFKKPPIADTISVVPPGNRLEGLQGDRRGQHSIRINDQWRLCFEWRDGAAWEVEIVDYHKG